jgi:PHD/YefM family antitoxin component YafN of YafNO toxin-antitoxin module
MPIMEITTLSARKFNQWPSEAKRAANNGPVFITDRGQPAYVLMRMELYQRMTGSEKTIIDLLTMPEDVDVDLEIPRSRELARIADFS